MKRLVIGFALVTSIVTPSFASEWALSSVNVSNDFALLINTDSLERNGDYVSFWSASVNTVKKLPFDAELVYVDVDCKQKRYMYKDYSFYLKGKELESGAYPSKWERPRPDTIVYAQIDMACSRFDLSTARKYQFANPKELAKGAQRLLRDFQKEEIKKKGKPF